MAIKIPNFAYPFKKNRDVSPNKSIEEIFEEKLFLDKNAQYLFNSSGLFHGGIHLKASEFESDFDVKGIRAIADGEVIAYRLDKVYLKNTLKDLVGNEYEVSYSSSFFLLKHKMEYPANNILTFYSLYMHTAPLSDYSPFFTEHTTVTKVEGSFEIGDTVIIGDAKETDGEYELLTVNGAEVTNKTIKLSDIEPKKVTITVKMASKLLKDDGTREKSLEKDASITINAYRTKQQQKDGKFRVFSYKEKDIPNQRPKTKKTFAPAEKITISANFLELASLAKEKCIQGACENGIVRKSMKGSSTNEIKTVSIQVKAGDYLGRLGLYNHDESDGTDDKLVHLEVFTLDDIASFKSSAEAGYNALTDAERELEPSKNIFLVKDNATRYTRKLSLYATMKSYFDKKPTSKRDNLRNEINRDDIFSKKIKANAIITIGSYVTGERMARYPIRSVVSGDATTKSALESDTSLKTWTVYKDNIEKIYYKFIEEPTTKTNIYHESCNPITHKMYAEKGQKFKDVDGNVYLRIDRVNSHDIYVKEADVTTSPNVFFEGATLVDEVGKDKIGIFDDITKYYSKDNDDTITQVEKEALNETFKGILKTLKVDSENESGEFGTLEVGELAGLSLTKEKRKVLSCMMVKYKSEWRDNITDYTSVINYMKTDKTLKNEVEMFKDRLTKLAISATTPNFNSEMTFIHPIVLVERFHKKELKFTKEMFKAICPNCSFTDDDLDKTNEYAKKFNVTTPLRIAHFLAQIATETGCFTKTKENLYYSQENFDNAGSTYQKCQQHIHNDYKLGQCLFGYTTPSGTKVDHRGRGYIHLTHKESYQAYTNYYHHEHDNTKNFVNNPELLETMPYAMESAFYYWHSRCTGKENVGNNTADSGDLTVRSPISEHYKIAKIVSKKVNGGTNGLEHRKSNLKLILDYFKKKGIE